MIRIASLSLADGLPVPPRSPLVVPADAGWYAVYYPQGITHGSSIGSLDRCLMLQDLDRAGDPRRFVVVGTDTSQVMDPSWTTTWADYMTSSRATHPWWVCEATSSLGRFRGVLRLSGAEIGAQAASQSMPWPVTRAEQLSITKAEMGLPSEVAFAVQSEVVASRMAFTGVGRV